MKRAFWRNLAGALALVLVIGLFVWLWWSQRLWSPPTLAPFSPERPPPAQGRPNFGGLADPRQRQQPQPVIPQSPPPQPRPIKVVPVAPSVPPAGPTQAEGAGTRL